MKTLNEVISAYENCYCLGKNNDCSDCPYWDECEPNGNVWRDDVLHYLKEYAAGRPRWIPVTERMPETEETMAVICRKKDGTTSWNRAWWDPKNGVWHGSGSFSGVTHWMPISLEVE